MKIIYNLVKKDIRRNIYHIILIYIQVFISCFLILMSSKQISDNLNLKNYIDHIKSKEIVTFKSYYNTSSIIEEVPEEVELELMNIFDKQKLAYSYSLSGFLNEYPNTLVYIFTGDFYEVFDLNLPNYDNQMIAFIGYDLLEPSVGDSLTFGYENFESVLVQGVLEKDSSFFHRNFRIPLDNSIVIVAPYEKLHPLFGNFINEELIQNTNFIKPSDSTIELYVNKINKSNIISVIPYYAEELYKNQYRIEINNGLFFLLFFLIAFLFNILGMITNLINTVNKNMIEYTVHLIYGATIINIIERITMYLLFIIIPPILSVFILCNQLGYLKYNGLTIALLVVFIIIVLLLALYYPYVKLKNKDIYINLRRDSE